jgi:molybdenum cofactor synthesis domain-containing protein
VIPVDEALKIVLSRAGALPSERIPLESAVGRVLAEDALLDVDLPPFHRSAMDGYALRAEDVVRTPVLLEVTHQVRAGQDPGVVVGPGEAVQIMTGAPVPAGATAVQRVEATRSVDDGQRVEILEAVDPGAHIARKGSEARAGDVVLRRGETIDPAALAVLASAGHETPKVARRPRVAILVTGDELVEVRERPTGGRIRNSNGPVLAAQARSAGAEVRSLGVAGDRLDDILAALRGGLEEDVVVVSGGVSVGTFDLVEAAFARLDVEVLFDKVAIKPGAPLVFGHRGGSLVFGLPGNPVSAQVTFDVFVRAALKRMQSARIVSRPTAEVELLDRLSNRSGRRAHLPVRARFEGGRFVARAVRSMGSADVVAHSRANALVVLEAQRVVAEAGERAPALLLGSFLDRGWE